MQPSDPELSIGVFARKSRLSMRALRLYEQMGVLKPVRVDPHNGYRWYAESQLAVARLIGMLRALDMPLAQVAEVTSALGASISGVTRVLPSFGSSEDARKPGLLADSRAACANLLGCDRAAHRLPARVGGSPPDQDVKSRRERTQKL